MCIIIFFFINSSQTGKTFMPQCFVCRSCNQELGTKNFFERDGFAYCEMCYHIQFSPRYAEI